jgi:hypothetical protein
MKIVSLDICCGNYVQIRSAQNMQLYCGYQARGVVKREPLIYGICYISL